jgi:hypothetical protein
MPVNLDNTDLLGEDDIPDNDDLDIDGTEDDLEDDEGTQDQEDDDQSDDVVDDTSTDEDDDSTDVKEPEEPGVYEIEGVGEFTKEDVTNGLNIKKWRASLNKKGEELNTKLRESERKLKDLDTYKQDAETYRNLKARMTPEAYEYLKKLQVEGTDPRIAKLERKFDDRDRDLNLREAASKLKVKYPDFDFDAVNAFMSEYDWDNPSASMILEVAHLALTGRATKATVKKAVAKVTAKHRKQPGLVSTKGDKGRTAKNKTPLTAEEGLEQALADIEAGTFNM